MKSNTILETYTTLLPWNLARTKCFVSMILGMVSSGSVQQHKAAIGFPGPVAQSSVCARIRDFLKNFTFDFVRIAKGRSSRKIQQEFPHIGKGYWGRYFWGRGFFSSTSGNVTDDIINDYINHLGF